MTRHSKKSLRELVGHNDKTHFKAAKEAIIGETRSMRFKDAEFKKLIKIDKESPIINQLEQIDDVQFSKSPDRLKKLTKEVLRACNVIRPDMGDLWNLPVMR